MVTPGEEETLGWRPAVGLAVPGRDHWRLQRKLGEGGFGEVWLALHDTTREKRVFKFCFELERVRGLKREVVLFRLLKEALGARDDIARVLDWQFERPPYFLEAEYTEGGDLKAWAEAQGGLDAVPLAVRLDLVAQTAEALGAAHSVGVLHKDIKPDNILIVQDKGLLQDKGLQPLVRLTDFGIGLITDPEALHAQGITAAGLTQTLVAAGSSSGSGTRLYMAPELVEGKTPTTLSDIYALAVVLYQMAIADFSRTVAPGWERDIEDDLLRGDIALCVDGRPEKRVQSANEVGERLRDLDTRRDREEARRKLVAEAEEARRLAEISRRRRRYVLAFFCVGIVLTLAIALIAVREYRRAEEQARLHVEAAAARQDAECGRYLADIQLAAARLAQGGPSDGPKGPSGYPAATSQLGVGLPGRASVGVAAGARAGRLSHLHTRYADGGGLGRFGRVHGTRACGSWRFCERHLIQSRRRTHRDLFRGRRRPVVGRADGLAPQGTPS